MMSVLDEIGWSAMFVLGEKRLVNNVVVSL